jgi:integrase
MKRTGRHPSHALTPARIRSLSRPGRYADGNGLYVVVDASGAKRWLLRTVVQGKRRDIGLGGLSVTSLAAARAEAERLRGLARAGGDPLAARRLERRVTPSFASAARSWVRTPRRASRTNVGAVALASLRKHAFPVFGDRPVDSVTSAEIAEALSRVQRSEPQSSKRILQRVRSVFDWAIASGYRSGANPVDGVPSGPAKRRAPEARSEPLPHAELPGLIHRLADIDAPLSTRLALEFLILTAASTSEVLGATWDKIRLGDRSWRIPKGGTGERGEQRVPLSPRCLAILIQAKKLDGAPYIFPGRRSDKPLSDAALSLLLRRMKAGATAPGLRSAFRQWASEQTRYPELVRESVFADARDGSAEAALRGADLLEARRELMNDWAAYCASQSDRAQG